MKRRAVAGLWHLLWLALIWAVPARAVPQEGFDYEVRSPPPAQRPMGGRVEVIEFLWYQCPHCNTLVPLIEPWARAARERVDFIRVPMALQRDSARQVAMYYALETLGEIERLHPLIFQAIHEDRVQLKTPAQMADFFAEEGVPRQRFLKAMRSAEVGKRVARARHLASLYGIREVPTLVVDGRFITSASHVGGTQADAMTVLEWLVRRVETERRPGGSAQSRKD